MASEVVTASIPAEQRAVWDRLSEAHGGGSKLVQWMLATLAPVEGQPLSVQAQTLRDALLRAQVTFLRERVAADQAELERLAGLVRGSPAPGRRTAVEPETWWAAIQEEWGELLSDLPEQQLRALAERSGADPDACVALVRGKRDKRWSRLRAARN